MPVMLANPAAVPSGAPRAVPPVAPEPSAPDLLGYADGHGHDEFPCLSRAYSTTSCVPCRDFSPWLRERITRGDAGAVGEYLWRVREANPGIGGTPEHFRTHYYAVARAVLQAQLDRFLRGGTPDAYLDLRVALVVMAAHDTFSGFVMTGEAADYLAAVMAPHRFTLADVDALVERRNRFVAEMGREMSYWAGWPTLTAEALRAPSSPDEPSLVALLALLGTLPLGARAHAVDALRHLVADPGVPRTLTGLSRYDTRRRGLDVAESTRRIVESGLVGPAADVEAWLRGWTRRELLGYLAQAGVRARNSWSKEKLAEVAATECREPLAARMADSGTVELASQFAGGAAALRTYLDDVRETWRVWLAFGTGVDA